MFANLDELLEFEYQIIKIMHENKKLLPDDNNQLNMLFGLAGNNERAKVLGEKVLGYDFILMQLNKYGVDVSSLTHVTEGESTCPTRAAEHRNEAEESIPAAVCEHKDSFPANGSNFCPDCLCLVPPLP